MTKFQVLESLLSPRIVRLLIGLNLFLAIASNWYDFQEWSLLPWYLWPFLPICPLYPALLTVWWLFYYFKKRPHTAFTAFIWIGTVSYGLMAYIYYPIHMSFNGFDWFEVGNILWVTIYASQSIVLFEHLRKTSLLSVTPVFLYFLTKDFTDRFLGTFSNVYRDAEPFPVWLMNLFFGAVVVVHVMVFYLYLKKTRRKTSSFKGLSLETDRRQIAGLS